ncbi:MAG: hypothetical protein K5683_03770 [Prevotella sp.]|nr:hypothetical protein [Prevotella sp.]
MTKKRMVIAALVATIMAGSVQAQNEPAKARNYFVTTSNVIVTPKQAANNDSTATAVAEEGEKRDFISRNFRYVSMCDWQPGFRFMVKPTQKDLVIKSFAEGKTGNMVSTRSLENKILVYDGHSKVNGSLHEHVDFYLENDPSERYFFEVPTPTFDDYCYGKVGVPALAYLGDVDTAMDSLVGKKVRVLVREFYQDTENDGGGFKPVDIGAEAVGTVMEITKVGIGTRNFPVKIIVKEADKEDGEGQEYFQYVTISRTNCGYRSDELEVSDLKPHTFEGSFQLLDDKMAVSQDLYNAYVGKKVYTFFDTQMRNSKEKNVKVMRLSTFTVKDIFRLGDSNVVTLTLKGEKSGQTYTKEVSLNDSQVNGSEEVLSELFVEGDPEKIAGVKKEHLPYIQKQQVKKGFTEAEVRLTLGEPTDITRTTADIYQWTYMFKNDSSRPFRVVKFRYKTKTVAEDMTK